MDVNSGMLFSSLVNTGKDCSPSTSASEDAVVFRLKEVQQTDNF